MYIKQITVFLENKPGRMAALTQTLAENNIDIRALSLADTTNFGILRLIVDDPAKAQEKLKQGGYTVNLTPVIAVRIDDRPGGLAKALAVLDEGGVAIEYLYAFISRKSDMASVVMRVDDGDKAVALLEQNSIVFLRDSDMENL